MYVYVCFGTIKGSCNIGCNGQTNKLRDLWLLKALKRISSEGKVVLFSLTLMILIRKQTIVIVSGKT